MGAGCTWIFSQITQNPLWLVRITSIVLRTTQTRLWLAIQVINYRANYWQSYIKRSLSLKVSFVLVEFVNLRQNDRSFWSINHGSRQSSFSEGELFSVWYWLSFEGNQLVFGPGQVQVHRECVWNQVSYLTSPCQWNVRILSVILWEAGWKDFLG